MVKLTAEDVKSYIANTPQITFEITESCNLSCVYCGYGKLYNNKGERHHRMMMPSMAIAFLNFMASLWDEGYDNKGNSPLVISFYGGEPLLNMPLIVSVIDYIEKYLGGRNRNFVYTMTTNAILLPKYMDYIVAKNIHLLISLDGDEQGTACRQHHNGQPAFNDIINGIDELRDKYPRFFEEYVQFNSVLTKNTSVKNIVEYINHKYAKQPTISEVNPDGINPQFQKEFNQVYLEKWKSVQEYENDLGKDGACFEEHPRFEHVAKYILKHSPYVYHDYNELLFGKEARKKSYPTGTCLPFTKKIFVNVTGTIMPCEMISYRFGFEAIKNDSVKIDYQAIADVYNTYFEQIEKKCRKCSDYEGCQCCMFNNGLLTSSINKCNYFVDSKKMKLMENEVYSFLLKYPDSYSYIMSKFEVL